MLHMCHMHSVGEGGGGGGGGVSLSMGQIPISAQKGACMMVAVSDLCWPAMICLSLLAHVVCAYCLTTWQHLHASCGGTSQGSGRMLKAQAMLPMIAIILSALLARQQLLLLQDQPDLGVTTIIWCNPVDQLSYGRASEVEWLPLRAAEGQ